MKKLLFILLPVFLFCVPPNYVMEELSVNECMNDIYYINDMFVLESEAIEHRKTLYNAILHEKYNSDQELMSSVVNIELLYNYSAKEKFGDTFIAELSDTIEKIDLST